MIAIDVPGFGKRAIEHVVLDFNGTLARDGQLLAGVEERIALLSIQARLHVCTADTFGTAVAQTGRFDLDLVILNPGGEDQQKAELVRRLGPLKVVAIGNGRNDVLMLREAALGVALIGAEGASPDAVNAAQLVCTNINDALDLLLIPKRLVATLRK